MKKIEVKIPGKLMLAGEWAILEPGNSCIALAINKYMHVSITPAPEISVYAPDIHAHPVYFTFDGASVHAQEKPNVFLYAQKSIEAALVYLTEQHIHIQSFALEIDSRDMLFRNCQTDKTHKLGFGSSAAVTVGIISAILKLHEREIEALDLYKLSYLAYRAAQPEAFSGYDLAVSAYQKPILYTNPDVSELLAHQEHTYTQRIKQAWPKLEITPITLPTDFILNVCFSGYPASTPKLVTCMHDFRIKKPEIYTHICKNIHTTVLDLVRALIACNQKHIYALIEKNELLLHALENTGSCILHTPELTQIIECARSCGAAGKISGAGGGDCGIAVCFDPQTATNIHTYWKAAGLYPVPTEILS